MSSADSAQPPARQLHIGSSCEIQRLSDGDLAEIFKRLPPADRLRISEVCRRWNSISRTAWTDITYLDLSPIPGRQIAPIVCQCPNLQAVFARGKTFGLDQLHILACVTSLRSLKFYDCEATIVELGSQIHDAFAHVFSSRNLHAASWRELVLHNFLIRIAEIKEGRPLTKVALPPSLPAALTRLQISGLKFKHGSQDYQVLSGLHRLEQLQNLECLELTSLSGGAVLDEVFRHSVGRLANLRELYLGRAEPTPWESRLRYHWPIFASLSQLEVLFLHHVEFDPVADFALLLTKHPSLRILVLTGKFKDEVTLPVRVRYPNGFHAAAVPTLHVFLGKEASEKIRFARASNDTLEIYPVFERLPQFRERGHVAPIFEGVWLAAKIKEAAQLGAALSAYEGTFATSIRHTDD